MSARSEIFAAPAVAPHGIARLIFCNLAAQSAEQIAVAAAAIVAVADLGAAPGQAGWLQTAQTLPFLLLTIPAGLAADRASRTRLMVGAEALRAVCLLGLVTLAARGSLTLPLLGLFGFLAATGTLAYSVAAPSLVPALARREHLARVNTRLELARSAAFAAGPALAGFLVARGAGLAFGAAALLSITGMVLLAGLREPPRTIPVRRPAMAELGAGIVFIARHKLLRPVALTAVVFNLSFFVMQAIYVPHAVSDLDLSSAGIGAGMASYGAGMLAGALLALARRLRFGPQVAIGPLVGFAASLAMLATLAWPTPLLAALSFFLIGAAAAALIASGPGIGACLFVATTGFAIQAAILLASPIGRLSALPDAVSDWT